ncbi:UNVERIFIED_CONTAM: hypothetical protein NCL1_33472 [Trichonephila clavipes]
MNYQVKLHFQKMIFKFSAFPQLASELKIVKMVPSRLKTQVKKEFSHLFLTICINIFNILKLGTTLTKIGYIFNLENLSFIDAVHKNTIELLLRHFKQYFDNYPERMKYVHIINGKLYVLILLKRLRFH